MPPDLNENEEKWLKTRRFFGWLIILGILFAELFLYLTPIKDEVSIPTPVWFAFGGALLFTIVLLLRPPEFITVLLSRFSISGRTMLIIASIGLSVLVMIGSINFARNSRTIYIPLTTLWLISAFCYVAAYFSPDHSLQRVYRWLKSHRGELIVIGLITLLGLILRLYKLGEIPFVVNGDEGVIGAKAQSSNQGPLANPFALWDNFGAFYLQLIANSMKIFGVNTFALRLIPAIGGIIAIPAVYVLAREISGKKIALISAFILATAHAHISFSRVAAIAYIQGTWLVPLEFFFLLRGLKYRSSWLVALGGVLLAIHYCIYISSQIATALILVYMLILFIFYRTWFKSVFRQFLVFWAGYFIVFLPEMVYILQSPDIFFDRLNAAGTFQTSWLVETIANTGKPAIQILGERVFHAFLTLIYYPAIDFYGVWVPLLPFITTVFFLVGLFIVLFRTRDKGYLLINGYFWAFTLAVGLFALPPSADSYRMLSALPAVVIIAAVGFDQILEIMRVQWERTRIAYILTVGVTLAAILGTNIWIYFSDFAGRCGTEDIQTHFSTHLGYFLGSIRPESTVYLLNDNIIFYGANAAVDFLSNKRKITNVPGSVNDIAANPDTVIVAVPSRMDELRRWAQNHPGGEFTYRKDCQITILIAYSVP